MSRTVLYNGRIATPAGFVRGMATDGQRIALLGSSEEVLALHADERIDLEGRLVLPGFIDGLAGQNLTHELVQFIHIGELRQSRKFAGQVAVARYRNAQSAKAVVPGVEQKFE